MNYLKRLSISTFLFLMAYLAFGTSNAVAVPVYGTGNLTCYDSITYALYPLSDCASGGSSTATTAAAITLQATTSLEPEAAVAPPEPPPETYTTTSNESCTGSSLSQTCTFTTTRTYTSGKVETESASCTGDSSNCPGVSPAEGRLTIQNLSSNLSYTQTNIASGASLLGQEQKMSVIGFSINYSRDIGDWSYSVTLPVRRTLNNSAYSAINNTQLGLTFSPTYHLFLEQVHGLTVNLGGVLGYNHTAFSDVSAVRDPNGPYKLTDFSNLDTRFVGVNASLGKQLSPKTRLNLSINATEYDNDGTVSMGSTGSILNATAGLNYLVSEKLTAGAKFNVIELHQNSFNSSSSYNTLGVSMRYAINRRSSLTGNFSTMIGSDNLKTKTYMLNYQLEL